MRRRWSDRSSRRVRTLVTQLARSRLVRESGRMRADIHDGPEQTLQSEAGYSNARPHRQDRRNLLHRTAGPYIRVNCVISALRQALPVYPDNRTISEPVRTSHLGHTPTTRLLLASASRGELRYHGRPKRVLSFLTVPSHAKRQEHVDLSVCDGCRGRDSRA